MSALSTAERTILQLLLLTLSGDTTAIDTLFASTQAARDYISSVPNWYVDATLGSDKNDGQSATPGANGSGPFATMTKLSNVLCPNGSQFVLTRDVTVNVAAGTYIRTFLSVTTYSPVSNFTLSVVCAITSSAPITLSAVVQPVAAVSRGELTTLAGTFVSKERIRLTSGASVGAVAYSTGLHANAQNTYASPFVIPTLAGFHPITQASVGDTCVVDTLTVALFQAELYGSNGGIIVIQDAKISRLLAGGSPLNSPSQDGGGNILLSGCQSTSSLGTGVWQCTAGGVCLFGHRVIAGKTCSLGGDGWLLYGTVVQGQLAFAGNNVISYGLVLDSGQLIVGANCDMLPGSARSKVNLYGSLTGSGGALECENGPNGLSNSGAAVVVGNSSALTIAGGGAKTWGLSGSYLLGFLLQSNTIVTLDLSLQVSDMTIPSTNNVSMAGQLVTFAQLPRAYARAGCVFAVNPDPTAVATTT